MSEHQDEALRTNLALIEHVSEIRTVLDAMRVDIEAFKSTIEDRLQQIDRHLYYEAIDRDGFLPHFRRFAIDVEDRQRDLLDLLIRERSIPRLGWTIETDHPVASDTPDHIFPRGTINDNTRHPGFVSRCEDLIGTSLHHLDLGCAGGGLVWDFTIRGHISVGIEGSNRSLHAQRAEWRLIPDRLFTADLRHPFGFLDRNGIAQRFNLVTAWELFEHIPEWAVPTLLETLKRNLVEGGMVVASIATFQDTDADGHEFHATVRDRAWWQDAFRASGFEPIESPFAGPDYPRGSGNPRASDWNAETNPDLGFHIVARAPIVSAAQR